MALLSAEKVGFIYHSKYQRVEALKDICCSFEEGKLYAIIGPSGSGKTTLLSLLAGLDTPSCGIIRYRGQDLSKMDRDGYRRRDASVIYQSFNLFPLLTAEENVMYPLELNGVKKAQARSEADSLLAEVDLPEKIRRQFPGMMSGGEQQRVAIARALAMKGKLLLADEPTGNLDTANGRIVLSLLKKLVREQNYCVILITHDMNIAAEADERCRIRDGRLTVEPAGGNS